ISAGAPPVSTGSPSGASVVVRPSTEPPSPLPLPVATPAPVAPIPAARGGAPILARDVDPPRVLALAVVGMDEDSAAVLYEKDAHTPRPPASLTKIATAIEAIERASDLDALVETDVDSRVMRGSTVMGLEPGDRFSLRDLLYGLMLPSGNDAALAIGRFVSGS